MTPKKGKPEKPSFDEDEFKFSEDELGGEEGGSEPEEYKQAPLKPEPKKKFKISRKMIVGGIVGLVAIIAIFQFLTQKEKSAQPELPVVEKTVRTLTPPATTPRTTVATTRVTTTPVAEAPTVITPQPTAPATTLAPPAAVSSSLTIPPSVTSTTTSTQQTTQPTSANLDQVSQAILELRAGFSSLSAQFQAMSTQVQQMICNPGEFCPNARVLPIVKERLHVVKKRHRRLPAPLVYHVKALIPGRAWLESNRGTTTSVKVGDTLRNYGQITSINTNTGMVDTSSGRVIKYGRYDS